MIHLILAGIYLLTTPSEASFLFPTRNVNCGAPVVQLPVQSRIYGGSEAVPGSFPWTVMLTEVNYPVAGGSILNERFVLTAAHVFDEKTRTPSRMRVIAGKHHVNKYDSTQRTFSIAEIVLHEAYNKTNNDNDVALILLNEKVLFNDYTIPICLPENSTGPAPGTLCVIAGWGDTLNTANETVLNWVSVPVMNDSLCSQTSWYGSAFHPNTSFCAGYADGHKDSCKGDSGAPYACKSPDNGRYYVQGTPSWGFSCGEPRWPGVYVKIAVYTEWIKSTMNRYGSPYIFQ